METWQKMFTSSLSGDMPLKYWCRTFPEFWKSYTYTVSVICERWHFNYKLLGQYNHSNPCMENVYELRSTRIAFIQKVNSIKMLYYQINKETGNQQILKTVNPWKLDSTMSKTRESNTFNIYPLTTNRQEKSNSFVFSQNCDTPLWMSRVRKPWVTHHPPVEKYKYFKLASLSHGR